MQKHKIVTFPATIHRFYATQCTGAFIDETDKRVTTVPITIAKTLEDINTQVALGFTCSINDNSTISITAAPTQNATYYVPFFDVLTKTINDTLPLGENQYNTFHLAPSTTDGAIHTLHHQTLPLLPD